MGALGREVRDMAGTAGASVARAHGVDVTDAGKFRCPDHTPNGGTFTDAFGSTCMIPNPNAAAHAVAHAVRRGVQAANGKPEALHTTSHKVELPYVPGVLDKRGIEGQAVKAQAKRAEISNTVSAVMSDLLRNDYDGEIDRELIDPLLRPDGRGGPSPELREVHARVADSLRYQLEHSSPAMVIGAEDLLQVMKSGRFKSQFETGTTSGLFNTKIRSKVETQFGVPEDLPNEKRPVYGFSMEMDQEALLGLVSAYGDTTVHFKPEVLDSATKTLGDSMDHDLFGVPANRNGASISDDQALAAASHDFLRSSTEGVVLDWLAENTGYEPSGWEENDNVYDNGYVELQYHGGLAASSISHVSFHYTNEDRNDPAFQDLMKRLQDLGVTYDFEG